MKTLGGFLFVVGLIVFVITELWASFLCLGIIGEAAGFWGTVAAVVAGPLYAGFAWGNWFPLLLKLGGAVALPILICIGGSLSRE